MGNFLNKHIDLLSDLYKEPPYTRTTSALELEIPEHLILENYLEAKTRTWIRYEDFFYMHSVKNLDVFSLFMSDFNYDELTFFNAVNKSLIHGIGVAFTYSMMRPIDEEMKKITFHYGKDENTDYYYNNLFEETYKFRPKDVDKQSPASICELIMCQQNPLTKVRWPDYIVERSKPFSPQDLIDVMDNLSDEAQKVIALYLPIFMNS